MARVPNRNVDTALAFQPERPQMIDALRGWDDTLAMLQGGVPYAEPVTNVIAGGVLQLTGPVVLVDTEGAAASDDLERVDLTTVAPGRLVYLAPASASRAVVLKHQASGGTGNGEFVLPGGQDLTLTDPTLWAPCRRVGDQLVFGGLMGDRPEPGKLAPLTADVDMQGKSAINTKPKRVTIAGTSYTLQLGDRGKNLVFTSMSGCAITAPNSGAGWADGDEIFWEQQGGPLTFAVVGGGKPAHPLDHDRGLGAPSRGVLWLKSASSMAWCLQGATTALEPGSAIERTWLRQEVATSVQTDAASTAWKNACQLVHTPGDNERWLYIANGRWQSNGGQSNNGAQCRLQLAGAGPLIGPPRYATQYDTVPFCIAKAYGTSPGAQTINLDLMSASASYVSQLGQPEIQALRLETDEFMDVVATINATTNTYVDVVTSTHTLAADDYVALAFAEFKANDVNGTIMELQIDGATRHFKDMQRNAAFPGYYLAVLPFTATAASHTLVLKGRSRTAGVSTTFNHAGIVLLKKSRFQEMFWVYDGTETGDINAIIFADRVTLTPTLQGGWNYLVLANAAGWQSVESSAGGCKIKLSQNDVTVGQEVRQHTRVGSYHTPVSFLASKVITKVATGAEAFALEYASTRTDDNIRVKATGIVVLALKRAT